MDQRRIVVIGDIHGNVDAFREVVAGTGLVRSADALEWCARDTVYIQMGDVCDRGVESRSIYRAIMEWQDSAPRLGSEVIFLLGNHEIMEMFGYDRDAGIGEVRGYADNPNSNGHLEHQKAFTAGGWLFRWLSQQRGAAQVGRMVFGHGDLPISFQKRYVDEIHEEVINDIRTFAGKRPSGFHSLPRSLFSEEESIVWCRQSRDSESYAMALETFLAYNGASVYVCGHTPSLNGELVEKCRGKYLCMDSAMGFEAHGYGRRSAMVVEDGIAWAWYFFSGAPEKRRLRLALDT